MGRGDCKALAVRRSQQELGEEVACRLFVEGQEGLEGPLVREWRDPRVLAWGLEASSVDPDLRTCPLAWALEVPAVPVVEAARTAACYWKSQQGPWVALGAPRASNQALQKLVHQALAGQQVGEQRFV